MKVYFASDHAGFDLKNTLLAYVRDELGLAVEDCGAHERDPKDDYPDFVRLAAAAVARKPEGSRAIVLGASGQGEAMMANRFKGVRAAVYYGDPNVHQRDAGGNELSLLESVRAHNDANVLSIGARFVSTDEAQRAVAAWLATEFSRDARHVRRIAKLDMHT